MKSKQNKKLHYTLQVMCLLPLLVLGIVLTLFNYTMVEKALHEQVSTELENVASCALLALDTKYPGDYALIGEDAYHLTKGDSIITNDNSILDQIKKDTGVETTLFYQDTRILTTIYGEDSKRIVGTGANPTVIEDVLQGGKPTFYSNMLINDTKYFSYYAPLYNSDGSIVGMIYAGKPSTEVKQTVNRIAMPVLLISLVSMLVLNLFISAYLHKLLTALRDIRNFLVKVSTGNLSVELSPHVLCRKDELSEIGRSALKMQRSLRTLLELDALTELHNRRSADSYMKDIQSRADEQGIRYVLGIGDIDFFKNVNDTYGHECGDVVLKNVAATLKQHMVGKGFVARWGGEEFLFIFEYYELEKAVPDIENLMTKLRHLAIPCKEDVIHVTMTFGLTQGGKGSDFNTLLQIADDNLYEGKNKGRNCVIAK